MGLFRRRKPLHERLAEAGGLVTAPPAVFGARPPDWTGEQRGEPGIHGVPRPRRWDVVASAAAPALRGNAVHFVALPDGTLVVDEDEPDESLVPLAEAVEEAIAPPYRAEGVRQSDTVWGVAASRISVVSAPELGGEEAEYVVTRAGWTLHVDGETLLRRSPSLEQVGAVEGPEYVVRASRLDGDLWEAEVMPL